MFSELKGRDAELLLHRARANLWLRFPLLAGEGRGKHEPWSQDEVDAFAWIAGLAKSGHWGAQLVVKAAVRDGLAMRYVAQSHRDVAAELAEQWGDVAYVAALAEIRRPGTDWNCVERWLEKSERGDLARGLREARRTLGRLRSNDVWIIDSAIVNQLDGGGLLLELSQWQSLDGDATNAKALLDAACRIGSRKALAKSLLVACRYKPDGAQALEAWMKVYEPQVPAEEARDVLRIAAPLAKPELERLMALVPDPPAPGGILLEIAKSRAGSDPEVAARLLDHAYARGSERALEAHWRMHRSRSGPLGPFLGEWFARFPGLSLEPEQRFRVAVTVELGIKEKGIAPDVNAAMHIYAAAMDTTVDDDGTPGPRTAHFIAVRLDPRKSQVIVPMPALALRWYEHGIDRGSSACFDDWLIACTTGELGLKPDPDAALAMAKRWKAAADRKGQAMIFTDGLHRANKIANDCLRGNPALARRWLAPGVLLGYDKALQLLAQLGNQGQ